MRFWCTLIGFILFNIPGALIGFLIGSLINTFSSRIDKDKAFRNENYEDEGYSPYEARQRRSEADNFRIFAKAFTGLTAEIIKVDNNVSKAEIVFVKNYFIQQFGKEKARQMMTYLKRYVESKIPIYEFCLQIQQLIDYDTRLMIIYFLYQVAQADGECCREEEERILFIANLIGVSAEDAHRNQSMYRNVKDISVAYSILGVSESASDDEIKKAYKKLAMQYHPDRVSGLGEEAQKQATERFAKINDAYDQIKIARKMN